MTAEGSGAAQTNASDAPTNPAPMRVTHIYHSGFAVELPSCNLLFDWYTSALPPLARDLPLVVFVSHSHYDHYDARIWRLAKDFPQVTYVVDASVAPNAPAGLDVRAVRPNQDLSLTLPASGAQPDALTGAQPDANPVELRIRTLESNDEGVAFLASAQGRTLYFSGDLNSWQWDREAEKNEASDQFFRRELRRAANAWRHPHVDAAFVPVDPHLTDPVAGLVAYMEELGADVVFPMHYWDRQREARDAVARDPRAAQYASRLVWDDVWRSSAH